MNFKIFTFYTALIVSGVSLSCVSNAKVPLEIQLVAGDEIEGALANSVLLIGAHEVFLVDAQFSVINAKRVVAAIQQTHKQLSWVFFTHGHADHILGAEVIRNAFPEAKFIAVAKVADEIQKNAEQLRTFFTKMLAEKNSADTIASAVIIPTHVEPGDFYFDGIRLKIIELSAGESESATVLFIPEIQTLVAGDVVYNKVHLWLREGRFSGWMHNLNFLKSVKSVDTIYPGHGDKTDKTAINKNLSYIREFQRVIHGSNSAEQAIQQMTKLYPDFKGDRILSLSVKKVFKQ